MGPIDQNDLCGHLKEKSHTRWNGGCENGRAGTVTATLVLHFGPNGI